MKKYLLALVVLLCAAPAFAGWDDPVLKAGADVSLTGTTTVGGPLAVDETLSATEALTQTCDGWGLSSPVGASSCAALVITRTASGANLAVTNSATIDETTTGTWYRWDVATNLTAGSITPSFCGQSLTAISTTGALTTTYRLFCPYQAAALTAPVLTFVAATEGTVDVAATTLKPITSVMSGTGLTFKAGAGGFHVSGSAWNEIWQGADSIGVMLHGYDDVQSSTFKAYITNGGNTATDASLSWLFYAGTNANFDFNPRGTGDYVFRVDADSTFQIGDGTFSWGHSPYFGLEGVAEFDSKAWFDAGMNITTGVTVSGTAPGLSSCGTSPSIVSGSTDLAGKFTIPGDGTGCVLTFAVDAGTGTACTVGGANAATWTSTDTALTVTAAPGVYSYVCFGY